MAVRTEGVTMTSTAPDVDPQTVFVRGISFDVGDTELTEAFSAIGPVRHAFVVKDGRDQRHKGYGFVHYALQEDAERAVQELNGSMLGRRKLKVESAVKRAPMEQRNTKRKAASESEAQQTTPQPPFPKRSRTTTAAEKPTSTTKTGQQASSSMKHSLVRTIALGGLTRATIESAIALAKKKGTVEAVTNPAPEDVVRHYKLIQDGCSGEVVLLQYGTSKEALTAVAALHGQTVQGKGPSKGSSAADVSLWARQVSGDGLHMKRWRLVVRNMSFKVTEAVLREVFDKAGFVWEVTIPRKADGASRGFAFIGFMTRSDAERAIALLNATKLEGRPIAVDWAVAKRDYDTRDDVRNERPKPGIMDSADKQERGGKRKLIGQEVEDEEILDIDPEEERGMLKNIIAGILNEPDNAEDAAEIEYSSAEEDKEDNQNDEDAVPGSEDDVLESDTPDDDGSGGSDDEEPVSVDPLSRAALKAEKGNKSSALERLEQRAQLVAAALNNKSRGEGNSIARPEAVPGATVFIRDLPLDVTKDQLYTVMRTFGPVASARLVVDKALGKPKGTAFVDFRSAEGAQAAVEACAKGRRREGPGVIIGDRKVKIDAAVDVDQARKLAAEKGIHADGSSDRRNLYLAKEGVIAEGTAAWEQLSQSDKAKRRRAVEDSRTKLLSPNFCVSLTRLNVRNVPRTWDERQLKALFIDAVKKRATKANPHIVQVKILREDDAGGKDGVGRNKGIAFVEFKEHEHSLCALRQLNNNPGVWGKDHRPIVEFAIDDVRVLKKREARKGAAVAKRSEEGGTAAVGNAAPARLLNEAKVAKSKDKKGRQALTDNEDGEGSDAAPLSKRKLRQERRRMLKERQRAAQGKKPPQRTVDDDDSKTKSQRRREQRKRKGSEGAPTGVLEKTTPVDVSLKKSTRRKALDADGLLDRLAALGDGSSGSVMKRRRRKDTDEVDRLAATYLAPRKSHAGPEVKKAGPRWFDQA